VRDCLVVLGQTGIEHAQQFIGLEQRMSDALARIIDGSVFERWQSDGRTAPEICPRGPKGEKADLTKVSGSVRADAAKSAPSTG
jgi:hypothetical protein